MKKINISEAQIKTSPNLISLICTETTIGNTNLAAISWWTYLANKPPMLGFAINKNSYTGEMLEKNRKAILSLPGEAIAQEAHHCGCTSGRNIDKAAKFNINLINLEGTKIKIPEHSKIAFICTLENIIDAGDHKFYTCLINDIFYNENEQQLYAWNGYNKLAPLYTEKEK